MSKRSQLLALTYAGTLAVTLLFAGDADAAACLSQPNQKPAEGERWYYRTNRDTNQKCWYLRRADVETTGAETAPRRAPADAESDVRTKASQLTADEQHELFREFLRWRQRNLLQ